MNPDLVKLPDDELLLIALYHFFEDKIESIWFEYQQYISNVSNLPRTSLIFPIIFSELDFYDCMIARISSKLLPEILEDLEYDRTFRNR